MTTTEYKAWRASEYIREMADYAAALEDLDDLIERVYATLEGVVSTSAIGEDAGGGVWTDPAPALIASAVALEDAREALVALSGDEHAAFMAAVEAGEWTRVAWLRIGERLRWAEVGRRTGWSARTCERHLDEGLVQLFEAIPLERRRAPQNAEDVVY